MRWSGFSGQGPSLTSEAEHRPHQGPPNNPRPSRSHRADAHRRVERAGGGVFGWSRNGGEEANSETGKGGLVEQQPLMISGACFASVARWAGSGGLDYLVLKLEFLD